MHREQFTAPRGDRPNVPNIAIVITDGHSNVYSNRTIPEAEAARASGVFIYSIGVTNNINEEEVKGMSSMPQVKFIYLFCFLLYF